MTAGRYEPVRNSLPRRRCAYCEAEWVPGLPNHNGWPVCADHTTQEDLVGTHHLISDLTDPERLELDRLRKFVRRLAYVRSHMAAGDQAIMAALTDDRYADVLAGLDRQTMTHREALKLRDAAYEGGRCDGGDAYEAELAHRLNVIFCSLDEPIPGWDPAALAEEVAARLGASR